MFNVGSIKCRSEKFNVSIERVNDKHTRGLFEYYIV